MLHRPSTPPMGWNSWDCYGTTVTEAEVLANAAFMAEHLLSFGWDTIVIDADWSDPAARSHGYNEGAELRIDAHGRVEPDPTRFPSAAGGDGFAPLAAQLHEMGLKLGIHIMRGIPQVAVAANTSVLGTGLRAGDLADPTNRCEWNPHYVGLRRDGEGMAAYYRSIVELYAGWGVDFIKADDLLWPYQADDIEALSAAIDAVDRPIALSLSPGRDLSAAHLDHLRRHAAMWRICDDVWDQWDHVEPNFARLARWAPLAADGAWPDADMLPLGRIGIRAERGEPRQDRLTPEERRTLMTLWVMARSPLMIGGDLPTSDPATIALLTNGEVLEILRSATGNQELLREGSLAAWGAVGQDGTRYVAVFNTGETPLERALDTRVLGLGASPGPLVDLWTDAAVTVDPVTVQSDAARSVAPGSHALHVSLAPHACMLLRAR